MHWLVLVYGAYGVNSNGYGEIYPMVREVNAASIEEVKAWLKDGGLTGGDRLDDILLGEIKKSRVRIFSVDEVRNDFVNEYVQAREAAIEAERLRALQALEDALHQKKVEHIRKFAAENGIELPESATVDGKPIA